MGAAKEKWCYRKIWWLRIILELTLLLQGRNNLHPIRYLFRTQYLQGYFGPSRHRKNSPAYFKSIKENWKGGTVILDIENRVREGGPNKIDREILVSISDEGEGIDTKIVPSLFSEIVSTYSSKGTGLGLFISKSIVEAHGGQIWCRNNDHCEGATLAFSLPVWKIELLDIGDI